MKYRAKVNYHCDLMSDYRTLSQCDFDTLDEAKQWLNAQYNYYLGNVEEDPDNPVSDLYDFFVIDDEGNEY